MSKSVLTGHSSVCDLTLPPLLFFCLVTAGNRKIVWSHSILVSHFPDINSPWRTLPLSNAWPLPRSFVNFQAAPMRFLHFLEHVDSQSLEVWSGEGSSTLIWRGSSVTWSSVFFQSVKDFFLLAEHVEWYRTGINAVKWFSAACQVTIKTTLRMFVVSRSSKQTPGRVSVCRCLHVFKSKVAFSHVISDLSRCTIIQSYSEKTQP